MTPPEQAENDAVGMVFSELHSRVARLAAPPPAHEIITRGGRRRTLRVAVAACATVVAIGAGYLTVDEFGATRQAKFLPAAPSAESSPSGVRIEASATIPVGFLLHELEADERVDNERVDEACFGRPDMNASTARNLGEAANAVRIIHRLYVYPDEASARDTFATVRSDLQRCVGFGHAERLDASEPALGDEATTVTIAIPADGAGEHTGEPLTFVAVRVGRAIEVVTSFPGTPEIDDEARAAVPRLCLYDSDCQPTSGLPVPLPSLRSGGDAWVAVLAVFHLDDQAKIPGGVVATAAELGYRPTIVDAGCDSGARPALPISAGMRYAALYFGSLSDAQAFANALSTLDVRVAQVRTFCVP